MKSIFTLFIALLLLILPSCSKKTTQTDDNITPNTKRKLMGIVVYSLQNSEYFYTVSPLSGAKVSLQPGNLSVTIGSNGKYSFSNLDPGYYSLEISKDTYTTKRLQVYISNSTDKNQDVYLESNVIEIPKWLSYPLGPNGGAITFTSDGVTVLSHGSAEVFASLNVHLKNNQNYSFSCDVMRDIATQRAGFFVKRLYMSDNQEIGEYWNIDGWHNSNINLHVFDSTVLDSQYVWQDSVIVDTTYTYPDSVYISLILKAEGGTVQGMFNHFKIKKNGSTGFCVD